LSFDRTGTATTLTPGRIKVVITGSAADPAPFQPHIYPKDVRKKFKLRAKDPDDPLEIVIVRDMWLTGFDAPAMHTMYVDKPMQDAGLMQAIARVNRTFRDKPGGLIVDYIGIATNLRRAPAEYSPSDRDQAGVPIEDTVAVMLEKHDIVQGLLHGCLYDSSPSLPPADRLAQQATVLDCVMADPDRSARLLDQVLALAKAFALCGARDEAAAIRNDVRMFPNHERGCRQRALSTPEQHRGTLGIAEERLCCCTLLARKHSRAPSVRTDDLRIREPSGCARWRESC
jgi:type I restriction enzyme R subunit